MLKKARLLSIALVAMALARGGSAQERIASTQIDQTYGPGWTFTPTMGFAETYDDNVSLFAVDTADAQNNDYVQSIFPGADLHYRGRHTEFGGGYTGSFLNYHTFSTLDRWDQRGSLDLRRQESAHLKWFAHGSAALLPSTDLIDLGGIPYRHTGARTLDGRTGLDYAIDARNTITTAVSIQSVDFDRPEDVNAIFRGGHMLEAVSGWRRRIDSRLSIGADYGFRRASVVGDVEQFNIHSVQAAVDYELNDLWAVSGGAGVVYLQSTNTTESQTGPAWSVAIDRHRAGRSFHVNYVRSYIPAFGFGGTIQNQQVGAGVRMPLFGSRYWYTDNSIVFRDDTPLVATDLQLPLRSLLTYSVIGWQPQRYVRIEGFYARTQQTSLRPGGLLYRNLVGIEIVTSKPVRMQ